MRVLVVDQDSTSNLAIARSLRDRYTVDAVGSKAACLDLLRSNTFEIIVACERLEDGSGLELLGQVAKRWPRMLRLFAADRERLKLLRGRLGPFQLFHALSYPIDPHLLSDALLRAESGAPAEAVTGAEALGAEADGQHPFPAPQPAARIAPKSDPRPAQVPSRPRPRVGGRRVHVIAAAVESGAAEGRSGAAPATERQPPVKFPDIDRPERPPSLPVYLGSGSLRRQATNTKSVITLGRMATANPVRRRSWFESPRTPLLIGTAVAACGAILLGLLMFRPQTGQKLQPDVSAQHATELQTGSLSQPTSSASVTTPRLPAPAPAAITSASLTSAQEPRHLAQTAKRAVTRGPTSAKDGQPAAAADASADRPAANSQIALAPETPVGFRMVATGAASVSANPPGAHGAPAALPAAEPAAPGTEPIGPQKGTTAQPAARKTVATDADSSARRDQEPPPVIREATLVRRINPDYPFAARREGIIGSVDLGITVSQHGDVTEVAVLRADPPGMFEKSAVKAVRKWKYDPQYVDGLPADAHLTVHLDFNPG